MIKNIATWEGAVLWLRAQPDQQELVRACYFDDPLLQAVQRYQASEEWQSVLKILPGGIGHALDLGAGRGIGSYALAVAGWRVDALEPDPSLIVGRGAIEQLAREGKLPVKTLAGFAESIPAETATYDLVYGRQVMHHAQNLQTMCAEVARVLKPGGLFVATREHVISRRRDLPTFLNNHPLHHLYGGENAFMLKEYLSCIRASGLKMIKVLSPFDAPVNYFPLSQSEALQVLQSPLTKRVAASLAAKMLSNDWKNPFNQLLKIISKWHNHVPGRLYSFVARKP